jgi:hypothetical protein
VPPVAFAVAVTETCPFEPVTGDVEERLALAPLEGTVRETVTPLKGFPNESVTWRTIGCPNAVETAARWPPPDTTESEAGGPAVFVNVKDVVEPTSATP